MVAAVLSRAEPSGNSLGFEHGIDLGLDMVDVLGARTANTR
jgi:hypothetical protein